MKHPELKKEIDKTIMFFVETDIKLYGYVAEATKKIIAVQK